MYFTSAAIIIARHFILVKTFVVTDLRKVHRKSTKSTLLTLTFLVILKFQLFSLCFIFSCKKYNITL